MQLRVIIGLSWFLTENNRSMRELIMLMARIICRIRKYSANFHDSGVTGTQCIKEHGISKKPTQYIQNSEDAYITLADIKFVLLSSFVKLPLIHASLSKVLVVWSLSVVGSSKYQCFCL